MLTDWNNKAPPSLWDWDPQPDWPAPSSKSTNPIDSSLLPLNLTAAAAAAAQEPPIGLKLGKRTYFEDVCGGVAPATAKSISASPASSAAAEAAAVKRTRASSLQTFRCQVEGCHVDLTAAKDYHRKHRVCEAHSKSPRVVVAGQERRFCQQCSRFHDLAAFDEMKKSCRKRLFDHNARRRKPQPGTISFGSAAANLPLPFYDNRQQMNLLASRAPFGQMRPSVGSTWEGSVDFKLADMKGPWMKSTKGDSEGQLLLSGSELSNAFSTLHHDLDKIFPFKGPTAEILNQGPEASTVASSLNRAPDIRRAFSLLSTNSWVSAEPVPTPPIAQSVHASQRAAQQTIQTVNSASDYWQHEQPSQVPHFPMHNNGSQFQEFQLLKSPFGTTFFDSGEIQ